MNGLIFQRNSKIDAGLLAPNSSRFPSRFDRAQVYHRSPKIPPWKRDEILKGCYRLNSAQFHQRNRQSDSRGGGGRGYRLEVWKNNTVARGNVDIEPPRSMDDSSMIIIEIGVDVDEGPHPNMMIGGRG